MDFRGESSFDDKCVKLVRGSSFRNDLLQNLYFRLSGLKS